MVSIDPFVIKHNISLRYIFINNFVFLRISGFFYPIHDSHFAQRNTLVSYIKKDALERRKGQLIGTLMLYK